MMIDDKQTLSTPKENDDFNEVQLPVVSKLKKQTLSTPKENDDFNEVQLPVVSKLKGTVFPVVTSIEREKNIEVQTNRIIVKQLVDITLFLGKHGLAFRGHNEKWSDANQLIDSISNSILKSIVQEVNTARIFSISIDTTFDISRHEQVSFVIRYTYEAKKTNIDWKNNLKGQSYDGAANMRGKYNGLQAKIKSENNQAIYIWCWAHRLNLIVEQGVKSCLEAVDFFGIFAKVYDFICSSKNRVFVFEQNQKERVILHGQFVV
ncbi:zinc finger MYM-type protein 1-like [Acyrthosiphon pisum]|uniref:Zinc finger MYM-type protein 1-like n=1 Tax=Acyrthosiphon pisum TaxID=7029 RepID=A0A8R2H994_ACYPI|nr:zinc finger MYM-type protein 1-like [Acyrthosiphon pisum]|eukprot:XP_016664723.1 PREDICTED: zinc finger MYM-type protein 1-like [Acyrthosiphon pisum]